MLPGKVYVQTDELHSRVYILTEKGVRSTRAFTIRHQKMAIFAAKERRKLNHLPSV